MCEIKDEILHLKSVGLLDELLSDKTTGGNIIWATDEYVFLGPGYYKVDEITSDVLTTLFLETFKNRASKEKNNQLSRSKNYAEIFTPLWMCDKMNNYLDDIWFGRANVFKDGIDCSKKISLFEGQNWKDYVCSNRLEITCGEAPFLVSRYDVCTGESIEIEKRIGILDRKLRVVNENASDDKEWINWVYKAFESTYGYEIQGDNLLIARLNFVMTFEEHVLMHFNRKPTKTEYKKIINIITWNLWQMDGLTLSVPCFGDARYDRQLSLLLETRVMDDYNDLESKRKLCTIFNWKSKTKIIYANLSRRNYRDMKFDFIIGNPPYDESTSVVESQNGQKPSKNIFQFFQENIDYLAKTASVLIYPGARWIHRTGKGLQNFGKNQINDPHLARLDFYVNANDVFPTIEVSDGISIVLKKYNKTSRGFEYRYIRGDKETIVQMDNPGEDLLILNPGDDAVSSQIKNFVEKYNLKYLNESILSRSLFGIESDFVEKNPSKVRLYNKGDSFDEENEIKLLTNHKAGKSGRATWYIANKNIISNQKYVKQWQVVVSSFSGGGQKRDNQMEIIDNHSAFGRCRVALKSFATEQEAKNFYKYCQSYIIRFCFLLTDESLTALGKMVPDLLDYTDNNGIIDFSQSIDNQLESLFSSSGVKFDFDLVKERVDSIRKK